ncbi:MAG: tetratricopeptide repeat protein, partial [Polyangiaceae bacterium]
MPSAEGAHPALGGRDPFGDLPVPARSIELDDLPLPVVTGLPQVAASLPRVAASLPQVAASLPTLLPSDGLARGDKGNPSVPASAMSFGEIELPILNDPLGEAQRGPNRPNSTKPKSLGPGPAEDADFGLFGDMDLPREAPSNAASSDGFGDVGPSAFPLDPSADFGDIQLDGKVQSLRPPPEAVALSAPLPPIALEGDHALPGGGLPGFGEVDLSDATGDDAPIGMGSPLGAEVPVANGMSAASPQEMPVELAAPAPTPAMSSRMARPSGAHSGKRSIVKAVAIGVAVLAVLGGTALQLTPYGAFGALAISDVVRAGEYKRATAATIADARKVAAPDTYDAARARLALVYAAHARRPRARAITAYAAVVDCETSIRFGADAARASRAKQLLATLQPNPKTLYADVAVASQIADSGDVARARAALDEVGRHAGSDPIEGEIALLQGAVEIEGKNGEAAVAMYKRALTFADDARAHFGLARAYDLLGDSANTQCEIAATLATSPQHPGALTLRARTRSAPVPVAKALADLSVVLDGPARARASPEELSEAYNARGWVSYEQGRASDARDAFAKAEALNPRDADALDGQGRLFLNEGRYTEALARFDTSLQIDPHAPDVIADDADAKLSLERLADAKQQLTLARAQFPKNISIVMLLGKVEKRLGNSDAAEGDLRAATALVDPARATAVLPYVALSELLS